ncbi:MAG: hypothetical protein ABF966_06265 [Bifidobacterium psychraerophilum]|uniref:hypothetical protein n=1 Tax=Bifidobacterium psychraerophilum TaxID=218140 RepID=UPI0039EB1669
MSRNRKSAKQAGTRFETAVRDYLAWALQDERIMRPRLSGSKDTGDIANVCFMGQKVCIECKNTAAKAYKQHMHEAQVEAGNLDAPFYFVVQKLPGIGLRSIDTIGQQLAFTTPQVIDRMRREAPEDHYLHNTMTFHPLGHTELIACSLKSLAIILNHGITLGTEQES